MKGYKTLMENKKLKRYMYKCNMIDPDSDPKVCEPNWALVTVKAVDKEDAKKLAYDKFRKMIENVEFYACLDFDW